MKHIKLFNAFEIDLERICNLYDEIIEFLASDAKFYYDEIQIPKCFGSQNNVLNLIEVTDVYNKVKFYESEHTMRDVIDALIEHTRTKRKFIVVYIHVPPEHIRSLTTVLNAINNGGLNLTNLTIMIPFEIKEGVTNLKLDESIMKRVIWYHTSREADNKRVITMPDISYPKPKLEISEVTSHDDGSISVKIHIDEEAQKRASRDAFVNIIRAVNKTLTEHEEEILNGE